MLNHTLFSAEENRPHRPMNHHTLFFNNCLTSGGKITPLTVDSHAGNRFSFKKAYYQSQGYQTALLNMNAILVY